MIGSHYSTGIIFLHVDLLIFIKNDTFSSGKRVTFLRRIMTGAISLRRKMTPGHIFCGGHYSSLHRTRQKDRQTDRRTDRVIPIYPRNFVHEGYNKWKCIDNSVLKLKFYRGFKLVQRDSHNHFQREIITVDIN